MIKGKCNSFPFISTLPEIIGIKLNSQHNKVLSEKGIQ